MDQYSSTVKLANLEDDLRGQECVKPILIQKERGKKAKIEVKDDGTYLEIGQDGSQKVLESAKITLNDCLACSGCVTTTETVLITAQSIKEFTENVKKQDKLVVVSISPQSRASLAAHYHLSILETHKKLITFFKNMGVSYVFDTSFSREFALMESAAEFVARYRKQLDKPLPLLASACPGWICYAEKRFSDMLPNISTTKSPQQIMGTIVKEYFAKSLNKTPDQVYHTCVMPCYDKKLEASRADFYNDIFSTRDVDCVLASSEIIDLIRQENIDFMKLEESTIDPLFTNVSGDGLLFGMGGGGSGGYLEYIFKYAAKELFGVTVDKIEYTSTRHLQVAKLEVDGKTLLSFAKAYGFQNIQNVARTMKTASKTKKQTYDFVEVMACASGCLNGGGQIKAKDKKNTELLAEVEAAYNQQILSLPEDNKQAQELYQSWLHGAFSPDAQTKLHTQYHALEVKNNMMALKW